MQLAKLLSATLLVCESAAKLRHEFTVFIQGAFALLPLEIPGSRFKRAKDAQRYINGVVSGETTLDQLQHYLSVFNNGYYVILLFICY